MKITTKWLTIFFIFMAAVTIQANDMLEVGYTQINITPEIAEWEDADGDGKYTYGDGSAYSTGEKITRFVDGEIYIGNGKGTALYVHRPIWARILVINDPANNKKVALVSLDLYMLQYQDINYIKNLVKDMAFTHIAIHATHNHMGPDTLGRNGPNLSNGINGRWFRKMQSSVAKSIEKAYVTRTPAKLRFLATKSRFGLNDTRDPLIYDDDLVALQAVNAQGKVLVTMVQWANHVEAILSFGKGKNAPPEAREKKGRIITPGFPDHVAERAEQVFGGHGLFFNGAVGGLMTMLNTFVWEPFKPHHPDTPVSKIPKDFDGKIHDNFKMAELIGNELVDKLNRQGIQKQPFAKNLFVDAKIEKLKIRLDNDLFKAAFLAGIIGFDKREFDGDIWGTVHLFSQVSRIDIGPAQIACVPGEIFGEHTVGLPKDFYSKNGKYFKEPDHHKTGKNFVIKGNLKSMMTAEYKFVFALTNDAIGYMVTPADFKLDEFLPWIEYPRDHYEETQSVGIDIVPKVLGGMTKLFTDK